jgi:uracil-DNA glycosylase
VETTTALGVFPFGSPVRLVEQTGRTPKKVFVLGVYASAVHARWLAPDGSVLIQALAVASEPSIFWKGDKAEEVIKGIHLPNGAGSLEPAEERFNGPSGRALDREILEPLGVARGDAWLADLVPHACMNPGQRKAVDREYIGRMAALKHPLDQLLLGVPTRLADDQRRRDLLDEIEASQADVVILLGDEPIKHFLSASDPHRTLSDFGKSADDYGRLHPVCIGSRIRRILPLAHPRQVAGLGAHSPTWRQWHQHWKTSTAPTLLKSA